MEMRGNDMKMFSIRLLCCFILMTFFTLVAGAQVPVRSYSIKNGKMFITLGKDIKASSLDSFIHKYELTDLDLQNFINTGSAVLLHKLGWKVDINNGEIIVISKPLFSADNLGKPADRIVLTQVGDGTVNFPNTGDQVHFGYNRFKNKSSFAVKDSAVTFFLRGNTDAGKVTLAGSFNNWQPDKINMRKTDSGWVADIKLGVGKYWYKFIVDGNWILDKDNPNKENDGMGNDNSVYYKPNYTFTLEGYTNARRVFLSGSFNNWKERELLMLRTSTGWTLPVYLSEGTHTYRYIADGKWFADPGNTVKLPNEYGEYNSVVRIGKPYIFKLAGHTDAAKVALLGTFNNWKDYELLMNKTSTGWELAYTLGAGNYAYKFKVDGKILEDNGTKGNHMLVLEPNFTFHLKGYQHAKTVCIAGDMNNWDPVSFPMQKAGDEWIFNAHLNKGKHRYKFIVDGKWILDPANKLWEQNEYDTGNSVLWFDEN